MAAFIPIATNVANRISDMILLENRYGAGEKLPNEHELAVALGVSRTSIREAVKTLIANGLLRVERGRGTFVSDNPQQAGDPFGLSYLEDKKKVVLHWFEMRLYLEPNLVRLACERASDEEIQHILDCEKKSADLIQSGQEFCWADQHFHVAIAEAAHNSVIELMLPAIRSAIDDTLRTSLYSGHQVRSKENAMKNHRLVAEFIAQRDGDGGALAMFYHLKRGMLDLTT